MLSFFSRVQRVTKDHDGAGTIFIETACMTRRAKLSTVFSFDSGKCLREVFVASGIKKRSPTFREIA